MSNLHITYRKLDGKWLPCQDVGCDDFDRAEYNRYIVANQLFCQAHYLIETAVAHTPLREKLPSWIPIGKPPVVGKKAVRANSGVEVDWLDDDILLALPLVGEESLTDPTGEVV